MSLELFDISITSLRWTCAFVEIAILGIFSSNILIISFFYLFSSLKCFTSSLQFACSIFFIIWVMLKISCIIKFFISIICYVIITLFVLKTCRCSNIFINGRFTRTLPCRFSFMVISCELSIFVIGSSLALSVLSSFISCGYPVNE